jgi:hypothetical protein
VQAIAALLPVTATAQNTLGNIYGNQGIITQGQTGNNTIIQGPVRRDLNSAWGDPLKQQMLNNLPRDKEITVTAVMGDTEALDLAVQIHSFLKSSGFKLTEPKGVSQAIFNQPIHGLQFNSETNNFIVGVR